MRNHSTLCNSRAEQGYPCTCDAWRYYTLTEPEEGTMSVFVTHTDGSASEYHNVRVPEISEPITVKGDRIEFEGPEFRNPRLTTVLNVRSFYTLAD